MINRKGRLTNDMEMITMTDNISLAIEATETLTDDELNRYVDWLRAHMKDRANRRNAKARAMISLGTRVKLAGNYKPQYLTGMTGEVIELKDKRVWVLLDDGPVGKFRNGKVLTNPSGLEILPPSNPQEK